ncbi:twin-arginine translocation pathway signal [Salipiger aestuarii]|uniref:DUF1501 domain-containing protein n=1 Tax=Salipiger aestuarii TaxID=568098 RepID=UPI00123B8EFC|nr:DUF1501 domain-containing protein [Salipiger aestuarii]KAA8608021.1 twin-arginine translocation pathway signal [Salipiger aestuarii]
MTLSRRAFLTRSALIGCSLAASPVVTPVTFAAAPGDNRLVVIILRGAMDGLAMAQPVGDADWRAVRPGPVPGEAGGPVDLDGRFALHPAMAGLMPLWRAREMSVVHAVSTPYRDKRSHFDGQDLLEAGVADLASGARRGGWLNRLLQHYPGSGTHTAWAIGADPLAVLGGAAPVTRWAPEADLALSPQAIRLAEIVMQDDPAFAAAMARAFRIADGDGDALAAALSPEDMGRMMAEDMAAARGPGETRLAAFVAQQLQGPARIAAFSINGWDTHAAQDKPLSRALGRLSDAIVALKDGLGADVWGRTAVVAMTEFGRTVRINGTGGTDHGTGGAMLLAGGALHGGRVVTDWPGLDEASLYDRRDLMPTRDLRAHAAWLMRGLFGLDVATLERDVFPGLDLGADPGLLL